MSIQSVSVIGLVHQGIETSNLCLNGKRSLSYYMTSTSRQGIQSCATETAVLFATLRPTYALFVGTCAAMKDQGYEYVTTLIFTLWY